MRDEVAQKIVQENRRVYNRIADKFSATRRYPWDDFKLFDQYVNTGDRILDIGCGNGRLAEYLSDKNVDYVGIDSSDKLIDHARQKNPKAKFKVADATTVPFSDNEFNTVFCIATLHHIPSVKLRQKVIQEAFRVVRSGGYLIMTEWNLWNKRWWKLLSRYALKKLAGKSKLDWGDVSKPWKNEQGDIVGKRYLHPFTRCELNRLLKKNGFRVEFTQYTKRGKSASFLSGYNIVSVAQKP